MPFMDTLTTTQGALGFVLGLYVKFLAFFFSTFYIKIVLGNQHWKGNKNCKAVIFNTSRS